MDFGKEILEHGVGLETLIISFETGFGRRGALQDIEEFFN
jgi:hypothetical protein